MGVVFLTIWYTFLIIVFQGVAAPKNILAHGTDVLGYAGRLLLPDPWSRLLPLAVLSAVFATAQMQLSESSRIAFAMGRDGLLPGVLSRVHQDFRTPWVAGLILGVIPPILLIPYLLNTEATTAIRYVISADGLLYLVMYFIIAVACVWYYRRLLRTSPANVLVSGVLPLIGGVAMLAVFIYGLTTQRPQVSIVAGTLVVACVVVAIAVSMASRAPYFVQQREVHEVGAEVKDS
jgi:amino acid transporter